MRDTEHTTTRDRKRSRAAKLETQRRRRVRAEKYGGGTR